MAKGKRPNKKSSGMFGPSASTARKAKRNTKRIAKFAKRKSDLKDKTETGKKLTGSETKRAQAYGFVAKPVKKKTPAAEVATPVSASEGVSTPAPGQV